MTTVATAITFRNYRSYGHRGAKLPLTNDFTAIVGVNNTGKTSLLRSFWELREVYRLIGASDPGQQLLNDLLTSGAQLPPKVLEGERIFSTFDDESEPRVRIDFDRNESPDETTIEFVEIIFDRSGRTRMALGTFGNIRRESVFQVVPVRGNEGSAASIALIADRDGNQQIVDWSPVQLAIKGLADSLYIGAFRNAINSGEAPLYDLKVGRGFLEEYFLFRHGSDPIKNEAAFRMEQELGELFGFSSFQVNVSAGRDYLICTVNGKTYRGAELGAGIMQFIIVAVNVLIRRPMILLIDEPELNLHASLQTRFLALLASYASGSVIYSTHSLGLARTADEILISSRDDSGRSVLNSYFAETNLSFVLGELGYGSGRDTPYKGVLLVEGVTDVRALQMLLIKYGASNGVVILSLGGDNFANGNRDHELTELGRLIEKVFAIVDSERTSQGSAPKRVRVQFSESCERLGIKCLVLERRALENYFDLDVARMVYRNSSAMDFGHFEVPGDTWSWRKSRNWRVVESMTKDQFDGTDLGNFIQGLVEDIRN